MTGKHCAVCSANKITERSVKHNYSLISMCVRLCTFMCSYVSHRKGSCNWNGVHHDKYDTTGGTLGIRIPEIACLLDLCSLREICWCVYTSCDSNPLGHTGLRFLPRVQRVVLSIIGLSPNVLPISGSLRYSYSGACIKNVHIFSLFKRSVVSDFQPLFIQNVEEF